MTNRERHRLEAIMKLCARVFLHSIGEVHNERQFEDVMLLRAKTASVLEQLRAEAAQTTIPLANDETAEASNGEEIPF